MPRSASSNAAFTPDEPRSTPKSSWRLSGTPRRIDEALDPFRVDFIPRVAIALQRTAHDATVGETEELLDRFGAGTGIEQDRHRLVERFANAGHGLHVRFAPGHGTR